MKPLSNFQTNKQSALLKYSRKQEKKKKKRNAETLFPFDKERRVSLPKYSETNSFCLEGGYRTDSFFF